MRYRLLATDLDGTLLDREGRVHAEDREAIRELRRQGVLVTICTGRLFTGTRETALDIGVDGPIACTDGSDIVRARDGRALCRHPLGLDHMESIEELLEAPESVYVFANDRVYFDARAETHREFVRIWSDEHCERTNVRRPVALDIAADVAALVAIGSAEWAAGFDRAVRARTDGALQVSVFPSRRFTGLDLWGAFIRASGPTKGTALEWIAEHHGIAPEEVVAVGDWYNDLAMFQAAGLACAMGQTPDAVKSVADRVLDATWETGGGIAEAARCAGLL